MTYNPQIVALCFVTQNIMNIKCRFKLVIKILVKQLAFCQKMHKPTHNSHQLITYQEGKGYKVNPSAIKYLNSLPEDDDYSVLSIIGKSKTGKSFLLNHLIGDPYMFPINSCIGNTSQGIMISSQLLDINGVKVIVLDSEGFGALEGCDDRDCKFFMLNLLLSSVVLYNSMGTIDQQTLNNFSMIIQIGKMFQKQLQTKNSMPSLLWVLRDFSLKMQDRQGSPISPKQYLQQALEQQKGNSQIICHKNRIRRVIKSLFSERTCQTLVLPTEELPSESNCAQCQLRDQFIEDLKRVKNRLYNLLVRRGCKFINDKKMTISMFVNAIQVYVKCLNKSIQDGSMPKIENITFQLRETQAKGCKDKFQTFLNQKKRDILEEISEMLKSKQRIDDLEAIKNKFLEPVQKFYETTRNNIYQLTGELELEDLTEIKTNFYDQLERQFTDIIKKCEYATCQDQEIDNICEFLSHITNETELQNEYNTEICHLKQKNINKDKIVFANILMRVEIAYLRRKLQLSKQISLQHQKINLELQFTRKQLQNLQNRNKELENELISQIRQSRKNFQTPIKQQPPQQKPIKSCIKEPGLIRNVNDSIRKQFSMDKHENSTSKVESSSFYIPYVNIQKPEYLLAKIMRTLIKEDNKRNNYIEYVIDVNLLGQRWSVNRKFKDFSELHSILVMMFQTLSLPDCKAITGPLTSSDFNGNKKQIVQQRRRQLEIYLHELIELEGVRNSRIMQKFLKINKQYTVL